ncbi:uncharacterized protein BT62DRAFT_997555 [Guyanagaster necrorhizus]|uniref:Uncharacterized protein n=1 Tax=Guyanagaster necrorhizus TaxID=856835 RepID=A0A9P7VIP5_9AGAR|nr:uncharacterized protein BT62DRAFT_997555 [Guyanagaster necrorhizus MCA 3950]KAG7440756.1 hypothetical protein BT62DRAFT_997555 [Guyanagaster necrorhizus MCA 3950]
MSACNHAVSRTTIESFFSFKALIGLGITFPFNFFAREEARIAVATPPPMSCSRAKSCLNSSSPISLPSSSSSASLSLCHRPSKSRQYKGIGLGQPSSKLVTPGEVTTPALKRRGVSNTVILSTNSGRKLASSINDSCSSPKYPAGLGLGAPPTRNRGGTSGNSGTSLRDLPSTSSAALGRISPTITEPRRRSRKQSAGLGLGLPASNALHTTCPPSQPPPPPSEPSGIGIFSSSLSISSELCRLTSQCSLKPPPRSQPQPRASPRRLFSSKLAFVTSSKFLKRSLYTIPESSIGVLDQDHGSFIGNGGRRSDGNLVHSFGRTLF